MEQGNEEKTSLNKEEQKVTETTTEQNVSLKEDNSKESVQSAPSAQESTTLPQETNIFGQALETPVIEPKEEQKVEVSKEVNEVAEEKKEEPQQFVELQPNVEINKDVQVVYEYKPKKDYGIWPILAFFILIAGIIFALPSIQKLVNDYRNSGVSLNKNNTTPTTPPSSEDEPKEEITYFAFNSDTTVSVNKLTLNNFSKRSENGKNYLELTVLNKDNRVYNYEDKIFIELYNEKDTLLSRSLLENSLSVAASSSNRVSLLINEAAYSGVSKFLVKTIDIDDYPQINLVENLKDQEVLTCSLDNKKNVYTFKDYKLVSIDSTLDILKSSYLDANTYASTLASYRQTSATYGLINGVSSSIVDAEDGFTLAIKIDSKTVSNSDLSSLADRTLYEGDTLAKKVAFEMTSRGYTCN